MSINIKNQARLEATNEEKEDENKLNRPGWIGHNKRFYQVEVGSIIPQFKLDKTEEEILIELVRKNGFQQALLNPEISH